MVENLNFVRKLKYEFWQKKQINIVQRKSVYVATRGIDSPFRFCIFSVNKIPKFFENSNNFRHIFFDHKKIQPTGEKNDLPGIDELELESKWELQQHTEHEPKKQKYPSNLSLCWNSTKKIKVKIFFQNFGKKTYTKQFEFSLGKTGGLFCALSNHYFSL